MAQCRWCLAEFERRTTDFCSRECLHEFLVRSDPAYARKAVFARDQGVCTSCGLDCGRLDRVIAAMRVPEASSAIDEEPAPRDDSLALWTIEALGFGKRKRVLSLWQADHRVAVVEGGGRCGLGNLRTLCLDCHRAETRRLHGRLTEKRQPWSSSGS